MKIKPPGAKQLIKEIEAHLPLPVYATLGLSHALQQQGKTIRADEELQVTAVFDAGDMSGIICAIASTDQKEVFAISLTHLRIRRDHALRARIEAYQKARVRRLSRQRR